MNDILGSAHGGSDQASHFESVEQDKYQSWRPFDLNFLSHQRIVIKYLKYLNNNKNQIFILSFDYFDPFTMEPVFYPFGPHA